MLVPAVLAGTSRRSSASTVKRGRRHAAGLLPRFSQDRRYEKNDAIAEGSRADETAGIRVPPGDYVRGLSTNLAVPLPGKDGPDSRAGAKSRKKHGNRDLRASQATRREFVAGCAGGPLGHVRSSPASVMALHWPARVVLMLTHAGGTYA